MATFKFYRPANSAGKKAEFICWNVCRNWVQAVKIVTPVKTVESDVTATEPTQSGGTVTATERVTQNIKADQVEVRQTFNSCDEYGAISIDKVRALKDKYKTEKSEDYENLVDDLISTILDPNQRPLVGSDASDARILVLSDIINGSERGSVYGEACGPDPRPGVSPTLSAAKTVSDRPVVMPTPSLKTPVDLIETISRRAAFRNDTDSDLTVHVWNKTHAVFEKVNFFVLPAHSGVVSLDVPVAGQYSLMVGAESKPKSGLYHAFFNYQWQANVDNHSDNYKDNKHIYSIPSDTRKQTEFYRYNLVVFTKIGTRNVVSVNYDWVVPQLPPGALPPRNY